MEHDRKLLELTLKLAQAGADHGSSPVGCVIADERGEVLAEGRNRACETWPLEPRQIAGSPLAHAELVALLQLQDLEGSEGWTLYSSLEPCLMCAGAAALLGLGRVVWACDDPWGGSGRLAAWDEHPAFESIEAVAHPFADLEQEAARLFAPDARATYPAEGWALWQGRYPEACKGSGEPSAKS